jgi:hypothetical protein
MFHSKTVIVTPAMATAWLEPSCNENNRPVDERRVEKFADEMLADRWEATNQGIGFGEDGKLYDGQHRLWAVVLSGRPVEMLVCYNMKPAARKKIDGVKVRRAYDQLHMFAGIADAKNVTGWANAIYRLVYDSTPVLSVDDQEAWYHAVKDDILFASEARLKVNLGLRRQLSKPTVFGALVFAHRKHPSETAAFADQLATGADLKPGEAPHTLREFLLGEHDRAQTRTARAISLKTLRAVQGFINRERITKLQAGEEGLRYFATAHTVGTLPPPLLSSSGGRLSDADRVRYVAVRNETSMAKIVAKLRASGVSTEDIPKWCVTFHRFIPFFLQYPTSEVERVARERATSPVRGRKGEE